MYEHARQGRRVILYPIKRVRGAPGIVVGERQPLGVVQQLGLKGQGNFLAGVSSQQIEADTLELGQQGNTHYHDPPRTQG